MYSFRRHLIGSFYFNHFSCLIFPNQVCDDNGEYNTLSWELRCCGRRKDSLGNIVSVARIGRRQICDQKWMELAMARSTVLFEDCQGMWNIFHQIVIVQFRHVHKWIVGFTWARFGQNGRFEAAIWASMSLAQIWIEPTGNWFIDMKRRKCWKIRIKWASLIFPIRFLYRHSRFVHSFLYD